MPPLLSYWAGKTAFEKIKASGLTPDDVSVMPGAAGGPKWLVLNGLDRAIFSSWLQPRKTPLFLIGSSIAAWRFATVSHNDPLAALDRFEEAYLRQSYEESPSPAAVNREVEKVLVRLMAENGPAEILSHPFFRLNIMAVRCRGLTGSDRKSLLVLGLVTAVLANAMSRTGLKLFFERTLFYDPRDIPPFFGMNEFPIHRVPLNSENICPAMMASGSIPMIMPGVSAIPGAPAGVYRDGGIIDYHMNIPFNQNSGIVLFPHYAERIVPGWLDKQLPWRKANESSTDDVLMVAPTQAFIDRLPHQKIPDRNDFFEFKDRDTERVAYWRQVVDSSRQLADEFMDAVETGKIRERIRPIAELIHRR